jgi:putative NIF3 family GTP cyclohydrolase 1 type 2
MTVNEAIERIITKTGAPSVDPESSCDRLMAGDGNAEVLGIGSTFMATMDVLKRADAVGVNFIITHEPTWYTGHDRVEWLAGDPVYERKRAFIRERGIAIWRYHDRMHSAPEDGIYRGLLEDLEWKGRQIPSNRHCFELPPLTLSELCAQVKKALGVKMLRVVGKPETVVRRVGLFVGGFSLGFGTEQMPIEMIMRENLDSVICGDILEWTICPYVRDAIELGLPRSMIIVGHERSEEPGMKHLGDWLRPALPGIDILFLDAGEPFDYL